jgi:hypothetical protein
LILNQNVAFTQVKLKAFLKELVLRKADFDQKNDFSKMMVIKQQQFRCFIRAQKETQIAHFLGQVLLYNLIYKEKCQR